MKKLLCVLLFACPIFAAEKPNLNNHKPLRQVLKENETELKVAAGTMAIVSVLAAPAAPILLPAVFVAGIATRIYMEENKTNK